MTRMVLALMALLLSIGLQADVLLIEEVRQSDRMELPINGQSMAEVESRWGAPRSRQGPVGDPPITQWAYDRWSVYFEYEVVLFTVLHTGEVIEQEDSDASP